MALTSKIQCIIPKSFVDTAGLQPETPLRVAQIGGGLYITPIPEPTEAEVPRVLKSADTGKRFGKKEARMLDDIIRKHPAKKQAVLDSNTVTSGGGQVSKPAYRRFPNRQPVQRAGRFKNLNFIRIGSLRYEFLPSTFTIRHLKFRQCLCRIKLRHCFIASTTATRFFCLNARRNRTAAAGVHAAESC